MKTCHMCNRKRRVESFNKNRYKPDGLQSFCRECGRSRSKRYYRENLVKHRQVIAVRKARLKKDIQDWLVRFLLENPCVDCGETDIRVLEFDHVRGEKACNVAELLGTGTSLVRLKKEIAKCNVRCCNCHRKRTIIRLNNWRVAAWKKLQRKQLAAA